MTFERVYNHITDKCPQLAAKNTFSIHDWLAKGYDTEKDILPAIDYSCTRGTASIYSFSFFTGSIKKRNEERIKRERQAPAAPIDDGFKAKAIAFKVRTLGRVVPREDELFLQRYERENGQIAV